MGEAEVSAAAGEGSGSLFLRRPPTPARSPQFGFFPRGGEWQPIVDARTFETASQPVMGMADLRADQRPTQDHQPRWDDRDSDMDGDRGHEDAEMEQADEQQAAGYDHDDIENDRRAFDRPNQTAAGFAPPTAEDDDEQMSKARRTAPLSHHTPVTRFLSKQTLGFIPKLNARPAPLAAYLPENGASTEVTTSGTAGGPPAALTSPMGGGFRLPSLSNTPPLSPQKWTGSNRDERFPPFLGPPQRVSSCGSLSEKFATMSTGMGGSTQIPSLKEALERQAGIRSESAASTVSSISNCSAFPLSPPSASNGSGMLTIEDICKPIQYQRSASCPSDPTVTSSILRGLSGDSRASRFVFGSSGSRDSGEVTSPSSSLGSVSGGSSPQYEQHQYDVGYHDESEEDRHSPLPQPEYRTLTLQDISQNRLERSSSVDGASGRPRPPAESINLYQWLDHKPLNSLAESAHALQLLERSGRTLADALQSASTTGGISVSLFGAAGLNDSSFSSTQQDPRREKKLCAFPQCTSNAVTRGLCISHGGGRRCQRKGCTRGAQSKGLCVAHGGGRICRAKGCSNIQRSMGLCIRHGGGRRCCVPGCQKGVVRQDLCTAHGGKRKCRVEDCNKHVKKKGLCRAHANSLIQGGASPSATST